MDKLWNLSETADSPMRWPGLLRKGGFVPTAQQPGRPLWRWQEGQGSLGRWKLQILWLGGARSLSAPPGPLSPMHVEGAAAGTQEVLRKHPPALSSCSLHPTGPSHVSSQVSLPQEAPPLTRAARDLAWCKGSQAVPLPNPAQRPDSLHTHTCPWASPARQVGRRVVCLAPSLGLTPGGSQRALLEQTKPFPLGLSAAPLCLTLACPQPTIDNRWAPCKSHHIGSGPLHHHLRTVPSLAPMGPWAEQAC